MLGRLQITTKDALRAYKEIAGAVFYKANQKWSFQSRALKATTLEKRIQNLMAAKEPGEYILRENGEAKFAKTFVYAVPAAKMAHPRLFRSYVTPRVPLRRTHRTGWIPSLHTWGHVQGSSWLDVLCIELL